MTDKLSGLCAPYSTDSNLEERIIAHEGNSRYAYVDTLGNITVGIGRCLSEKSGRGLTADEIKFLFKNDIDLSREGLCKLDWFNNLDVARQGVMIELAFNIGIAGVLKFTNMIESIKKKDFLGASKHLLDSRWKTQVGQGRSNDMSYRLRNGAYL